MIVIQALIFKDAKPYRTKVLLLIGATDKELRADGNIYAGAISGCFIIEFMAQLAHQLAP